MKKNKNNNLKEGRMNMNIHTIFTAIRITTTRTITTRAKTITTITNIPTQKKLVVK